MSLYKPFLRYINKGEDENATIIKKIMASFVTGGFSISIANPADTIKTKLAYQNKNPHIPKVYNGTVDCFRKLYAEGGIGLNGLWSGYPANLARNSIMNPTEIVAFFVSYETILKYGLM